MDELSSDQSFVFSEISDILKNYDLGELIAIEKNDRGYVNTSFRIETMLEGEKDQYFFRQYKSGIQESEILFEHSVINHLLNKKFDLIASVFPTVQGETYIKRFEGNDSQEPNFFAVFEFLKGEDKYDCVDPHPSLVEIKNSAVVQAKFHHAGADLAPEGQRFEPKILDLLPQIPPKIRNNLESSKDTIFDTYLRENEIFIGEICNEAIQYFSKLPISDWVELLIHCDYHPGNLKFQGEEVVGLFDFDWSKIDLRSFDVALAIWYFFADWGRDQDGVLRIDETRIYLNEYQTALNHLPDLEPISEAELNHFPMFVSLGNLYVLNWAVTDFYLNDVDPELYLKWLKHSVSFAEWFKDSGQRLLEKEFLSL